MMANSGKRPNLCMPRSRFTQKILSTFSHLVLAHYFYIDGLSAVRMILAGITKEPMNYLSDNLEQHNGTCYCRTKHMLFYTAVL